MQSVINALLTYTYMCITLILLAVAFVLCLSAVVWLSLFVWWFLIELARFVGSKLESTVARSKEIFDTWKGK